MIRYIYQEYDDIGRYYTFNVFSITFTKMNMLMTSSYLWKH